jgi:hypothetical protein
MENNFIDSTEGVVLLDKRRCGNTTRIIDNAIQLLFQGYKVKITDHTGNYHYGSMYVFEKVIKRLGLEHHITPDSVIIFEESKNGALEMYLKLNNNDRHTNP